MIHKSILNWVYQKCFEGTFHSPNFNLNTTTVVHCCIARGEKQIVLHQVFPGFFFYFYLEVMLLVCTLLTSVWFLWPFIQRMHQREQLFGGGALKWLQPNSVPRYICNIMICLPHPFKETLQPIGYCRLMLCNYMHLFAVRNCCIYGVYIIYSCLL